MATTNTTRQISQLQAEKSRLLARIAQIDAEIADLTQAAELAEAVQEVLDSTPRTQSKRGKSEGESGHGGHWVEIRTVNGCGPYAYERWWDGSKKRSKYLGKAVTQQ